MHLNIGFLYYPINVALGILIVNSSREMPSTTKTESRKMIKRMWVGNSLLKYILKYNKVVIFLVHLLQRASCLFISRWNWQVVKTYGFLKHGINFNVMSPYQHSSSYESLTNLIGIIFVRLLRIFEGKIYWGSIAREWRSVSKLDAEISLHFQGCRCLEMQNQKRLPSIRMVPWREKFLRTN